MSVESPAPLAGVHVVDLSDPVGQAACRLLADLGADVVRLENPAAAAAPSGPAVDGVHLEHALANANKRGGMVDLTTATGRQDLTALLAEADLVFLGRTEADELGVDKLLAEHPHLVVVVSSPFGTNGPRRDWNATDRTLLALSGALSRSGRPGDVPLMPPDGLASATAATQAAWTAVVALRQVARGGAGQVIDLSHHEAVATGLDPAFGVQGSAAAGRSGKVRRDRPPADSYPVYPCADGFVRLCLLAKRQWRGMFGWLGEPAEFADPSYDSIVARVQAADRLDPLITALFADQPGAVLVEEAARRGVPLAQVLTLGETIASEHFVGAGTVQQVEIAPGLVAATPVGCIDLDGVRRGWRAPGATSAGVPGWNEPRQPVPAADHRPAPFEGLRVLDLGVIVFGAEVGRAFADLGADVIKIESLAFPDGLRQTRGGEAMNASFAWGQRNKRSLGLDLRSPEGLDLFRSLAAEADVVLANFKPGTLDKMGIGYDELATRNPDIVVLESAAFSSKGPWAARLGYGPLVRAACGISSLWRYGPDEAECWDGVTVFPDHVAAKVGALAVAAALHRRDRIGLGARLEVGQSDVVLHQLAALAAQESLQPGSARATGNRGRALFGGVFACAGDDEWCVIDARTPAELAALTVVVGEDNDIEPAVSAWTSARTPHEVMEALQAVGLPAAAMLRLPELLDDPQLAHRGTYATMSHPALDHTLPTESTQAPYGAMTEVELRPAPTVGEHTREICRDVLGLSDAVVDDLIARGVVHEGVAHAGVAP